MTGFAVEPRGPFSLAAAARFIGRWPPANRLAPDGRAEVPLAFLVDDWTGHAGVVLRQDGGTVTGTITECTAADPARVRAQAARIVSLDHDGTGYAELGERDPVIGEAQRRSDFLRPVLFHSPYEAACWAVISARQRQPQAAMVRDALSARHGGRLTVAGEERVTFPAPERLLALERVEGITAEKVDRLHGIARAALAGRLDRERLLAMDADAALECLRELRGIGPFWAMGVLLRAAGTTDVLPLHEPRVRRIAAEAYRAPEVVEDDAAFLALTERWRPFRTWVAVLLRAS